MNLIHRNLVVSWLLTFILFTLTRSQTTNPPNEDNPVLTKLTPSVVNIDFPKVVLYDFPFDLDLVLSWKKIGVPQTINYEVRQGEEMGNSTPVKSGQLESDLDKEINLDSTFNMGEFHNAYTITNLTIKNTVSRTVWVILKTDQVFSTESKVIRGMPGLVTLIPIVIMLVVAMASSQATLALLLGIFVSATFINGFNPLLGFLRTIDEYIINSLADSDHAKVIMFTFYLSATVALIQKSGGAEAMAIHVTKFATTRWRGQWCTYLIGLVIFIDDLASCMVVGANMRTVTDRLFLSREKLAYIVHVTSPTITSLSPVSSWIGYMLGLISAQFISLKITNVEPFMFFIYTIPSRFFPIFAIIFCGVIMTTRRDFSGMLVAERRAFFDKVVVVEESAVEELEDPLKPADGAPRRLINSLLPIFIVISITATSLLVSGYYELLKLVGTPDEKSFNVYNLAGAGDSYSALLYASFFCCLMCTIMYRIQNIITFQEALTTIMYGVKDMVETMLILVFAWGVGKCFEDMGVSNYIVSALQDTLPSGLIPVLCCLLAAFMSFTTGTSWGTMGIMLPLAMPLAHANRGNDDSLLIYTVSAAFSGALFGDMCSPISATTLLACAAIRIPIHHHVNTQLPYALVSLFIACLVGYLPLGFQLYPAWAAILIAIPTFILLAFLLGVPTESFTPGRKEQLLKWYRGDRNPSHPTTPTPELELVPAKKL